MQLQLKNGLQLLEYTKDVNRFPTNFVNAVLKSAENVVRVEEDKSIKKISEETHQPMEKRKKRNITRKVLLQRLNFQNYVKL